MTQVQVLCCPFCGSVPTMEPWHGGPPRKRIIHCDRCAVSPGVTGATPRQAADRWNIRAGERTDYFTIGDRDERAA